MAKYKAKYDILGAWRYSPTTKFWSIYSDSTPLILKGAIIDAELLSRKDLPNSIGLIDSPIFKSDTEPKSDTFLKIKFPNLTNPDLYFFSNKFEAVEVSEKFAGSFKTYKLPIIIGSSILGLTIL